MIFPRFWTRSGNFPQAEHAIIIIVIAKGSRLVCGL